MKTSSSFYTQVSSLKSRTSKNLTPSKKISSILKLKKVFGNTTSSKHNYFGSKTPSSKSRDVSSKRFKSDTSRSGVLSNFDSQVIAAVVEGRGHAKGEIGIASINLLSPHLVLAQFPDNITYTRTLAKLLVLCPCEIIMVYTPNKLDSINDLLSKVISEFSRAEIKMVHRKFFNETKGSWYIDHYLMPEYENVKFEIKSKFYCVSALAALLKYLEHAYNTVYMPKTFKVTYEGSEKTVFIDSYTVKNLELLINNCDPLNGPSLFNTLNFTKTIPGARLLRANILQPPQDENTIKLRQMSVNDILSNESSFYKLLDILTNFNDLEHMLALLIRKPKTEDIFAIDAKIGAAIYLQKIVENIPSLRECLKLYESPLLKSITMYLLNDSSFNVIKTKLETILQNSVPAKRSALETKNAKCFAIKSNINGLLDLSRRKYVELFEDYNGKIDELISRFNVNLKPFYNKIRGFHVFLQWNMKQTKREPEIPGDFIKVLKAYNGFYFTTMDILKINERILQSQKEIYLMSWSLIESLIDSIRHHLNCLYKLTECVSTLDMLASFANFSAMHNKFTNCSCFAIISGPNMSGKTTYLKAVCTMQIISQIGCFIPAVTANFKIFTKIHGFFGNSDDVENNLSSQASELNQINFILNSATSNSLLVIDEIGRNTNSFIGTSFAITFTEEIIKKRSFCLMVTHFKEVCLLSIMYPMIENFNLGITDKDSQDNESSFTYSYKLHKGICENYKYGINLLRFCSFSNEVLNEISEVYKSLNITRLDFTYINEKIEDIKRSYITAHNLHELNLKHESEESFTQNLKRIKHHFINSKDNKDFIGIDTKIYTDNNNVLNFSLCDANDILYRENQIPFLEDTIDIKEPRQNKSSIFDFKCEETNRYADNTSVNISIQENPPVEVCENKNVIYFEETIDNERNFHCSTTSSENMNEVFGNAEKSENMAVESNDSLRSFGNCKESATNLDLIKKLQFIPCLRNKEAENIF